MNQVVSTNQSKIPCETYNVILSRDPSTIASAGTHVHTKCLALYIDEYLDRTLHINIYKQQYLCFILMKIITRQQ